MQDDYIQYKYQCEATGTTWQLTLWSRQDCQELWQSCLGIIEEFEAVYSRFKEESLVTQLSGTTGTFDVPEDFIKMLRLYKNIYYATEGAFTPIGGKTLSDLGYDAAYTFEEKKVIERAPQFEDAVAEESPTSLTITENVYFDFGALGKGYLADLVLAECQKHETVARVLVNAGGDILHWSADEEKINVGMENPFVDEQVIGVYPLGNAAMACSASHKRKWGKNHHIYDAHKGESVENVRATWVRSKNAAIADALATALFVADPQALKNFYDFDYAIIDQNERVHSSDGLSGALFKK